MDFDQERGKGRLRGNLSMNSVLKLHVCMNYVLLLHVLCGMFTVP